MLNETKLTSALFLGGYYSHQTLYKRSGGCLTLSNLRGHRKVKALGTYLNWTKVPVGGEEVHILNVYLEPGLESFVGKRAETVIQLTKDIIKQDPAAKIIIGGDLNGQLNKMHTQLTRVGFIPALRDRIATHRDGNQLDQLWTRNLGVLNAIVAAPIDQVSDHSLIQVKMEAVITEREATPQVDPGQVDPRTLP
jgi:hypothetical protein